MYKILRANFKNLFPKNITFAYTELYIYPFNKTYFDTTKSIYLPSVIGKGYTNYNGIIEFQVVPNDLIIPKPNFYVLRVMYSGKNYIFVAQISSTTVLTDVVDLRDVLIVNKDECGLDVSGLYNIGNLVDHDW